MSSLSIICIILLYFLLLLFISWYTSRKANNESFYIGNRNSNWMLVAFGMIGTSLSGVTFISVPGTVGNFNGDIPKAFGYLQVVIGYFIGYIIIAFILLPLYYKLNLTSIYHYLQKRFGKIAYKTGAGFFILSRTVGATARLYLVINVLQIFVLDAMHVPFVVTTLIILLMILLYTYKGGVKTIVYTDTLQTLCMLAGLVICIAFIWQNLHLSTATAWDALRVNNFISVFNMDVNSKTFFLKQIIGGMFITVAMTGLDQEMMQKNISVRTLQGSQKNMLSFSVVLILVNCLFLLLGGLLYIFMMQNGAAYESHSFMLNGVNIIGDDLFPTFAMQYLPPLISLIFIVALISALFPSADGALTALTSSFCIDIAGIKERADMNEAQRQKFRIRTHLIFAVVFLLCILMFKSINDKSIINIILDLASYTYGPLLGLFAFGILTKRNIAESWRIVAICFASPVLCYFLSTYSSRLLHNYQIGIELLLINGIFTFIGLYLISSAQQNNHGRKIPQEKTV